MNGLSEEWADKSVFDGIDLYIQFKNRMSPLIKEFINRFTNAFLSLNCVGYLIIIGV